MDTPQQSVVQAIDNSSKLSAGMAWQRDDCLFQAQSCPGVATAGAGELRFPRLPPTLAAVCVHAPDPDRGGHRAWQPPPPFHETVGSVRATGEPRNIPITGPWASRDGYAAAK